MTIAKVWNGTAWEAIAGGVSQAQFDALNTRVTTVESTRIIATQHVHGTAGNYSEQITTTAFVNLMADGVGVAGTVPIGFTFTPSVNCFWQTDLLVGVVQKMDSAYHATYVRAVLSPVDERGVNVANFILTQHAAVQTYMAAHVNPTWMLKAGTAYTVNGQIGNSSGGTWRYMRDFGTLILDGRAWAR